MKVMLHKNEAGNLSVYVAKKDLEEEVVNDQQNEDARILTLANGWELEFKDLEEPLELPLTVRAKKL
ncbi:MAG: putative nitrogen fixation protein NifT [Cyanobacteria bacterium SBLK]|nr:putative nitrogen fixation protein NifT [Cyanobacteria bacterium SBLK]